MKASRSETPRERKSMPWTHDLVIRGGQVVDGAGGAPFEADVGSEQGRHFRHWHGPALGAGAARPRVA